jgi:hypothetical protein
VQEKKKKAATKGRKGEELWSKVRNQIRKSRRN